MSDRDLISIVLPDAQPLPSPYAEADRKQAVDDLLAGNCFRPKGLAGPFGLHIMVRDGRLILDIRDAEDKALHALVLALGPFRRLIKDYHLVVESHEKAVAEGGLRGADPGDRHGQARLCTTKARRCWWTAWPAGWSWISRRRGASSPWSARCTSGSETPASQRRMGSAVRGSRRSVTFPPSRVT
jgi:hypothetical protein